MAAERFTYRGHPGRVIFGTGTLERVPEEAERLGITRALVLSTSVQAAAAAHVVARLGDRAAGVFSGAAMHTPVNVTEQAVKQVRGLRADGVVAIGGGSTTGLGKAIAYRTDLPQLVIPTTYAGSEMTPILGQTEGGRKTTLRDPKVLPESVIYDVALTHQLPVGLSGVSGMNAIAHAVEALYADDGNPVVNLLAVEGISALARALPVIADGPDDADARADALYGAWLCGICLGSVAMALHHKLCHTLGGLFGLPHAETHAVILPHALRYNEKAAPAAVARVAAALGTDDAVTALQELARRIGAPASLRQIGMDESGIDIAVEQAMASPYPNPAPLAPDSLRGLLERAVRGAAA